MVPKISTDIAIHECSMVIRCGVQVMSMAVNTNMSAAKNNLFDTRGRERSAGKLTHDITVFIYHSQLDIARVTNK